MTTAIQQASEQSTRSQRWFARLWSWIDDSIDQAVATAKDAVFVDLPDRIVEIGPGRGSSFKRYAPGSTVVAFEPNKYMHVDLQRSASEHGIKLDLRPNGVEHMDLPDASQDAVVSSLTLCSVGDVPTALAEIQRVLKPGGKFHFVEHIAAEEGTSMARAQAVLRRPWARVADRCNLQANTHHAISEAGFAEVDSQIQGLGPKLDPSRRTVFGVAIR